MRQIGSGGGSSVETVAQPMANAGAGTPIYVDNAGHIAEFKTLVAGEGVTIVDDVAEKQIEIHVSKIVMDVIDTSQNAIWGLQGEAEDQARKNDAIELKLDCVRADLDDHEARLQSAAEMLQRLAERPATTDNAAIISDLQHDMELALLTIRSANSRIDNLSTKLYNDSKLLDHLMIELAARTEKLKSQAVWAIVALVAFDIALKVL